jgi:hypothetical protein
VFGRASLRFRDPVGQWLTKFVRAVIDSSVR